MSFSSFSNRSINRINLHCGFQSFADNLVNLFLGIYLYQTGLPLWAVFLSWGGVYLLRFLLRPFSLMVQLKIGLKRSLLLGTFLYATLYPVLSQVAGLDVWLLLFIFDAALTDTFYWLSYHTIFSILGDDHIRGKQTSTRDGLRTLGGFAAPVGGALLINFFQFSGVFVLATVLMLASIFPLIKLDIPSFHEHFSFREAFEKVQKVGFWLYVGDGFFTHHMFTWKLILFLMLDDVLVFGGLISLAIFFQIVGMFTIGHLFDKKQHIHFIYTVGLGLVTFALLGRGLWAYTIPMIIAFDLIYMMGAILYAPVMNSAYYNFAKTSRHPLWFQFFSESGWDVGTFSAAFLASFLVFSGVDLRWAMMMSMAGTVLMFLFTRRILRERTFATLGAPTVLTNVYSDHERKG